jgi:predicted nucleic acid-binding protein
MNGVLDASMALAWQFTRADTAEAALAEQALRDLPSSTWLVPAIWHAEVANAMLRGERAELIQPSQSGYFLSRISQAAISVDSESPGTHLAGVMTLARLHRLTAYDATYLELALRTGQALATFDRQLAAAVRLAGGRVFGDAV